VAGPATRRLLREKVAPWKEAPKVLLRVKVGEGHGSPVVAGARLPAHQGKGEDAEELTAYDAVSGKPA